MGAAVWVGVVVEVAERLRVGLEVGVEEWEGVKVWLGLEVGVKEWVALGVVVVVLVKVGV